MALTAHAYIVRGDARALEAISTLLGKEGVTAKGNPDVLMREYSAFTMDDARELSQRASLRSIGGRGRVFVIVAPTIAADAQNALLKTFEEPVLGTRFFLIVPSPQTLLPTLLSRMQPLEITVDAPRKSIIDVQGFLQSAPEKRIEMLKPLLEKDDDDRRDLSGALVFLGEIETILGKKPEEYREGIRALYRARKYIADRGALTKTLLEQAALLIPKVI